MPEPPARIGLLLGGQVGESLGAFLGAAGYDVVAAEIATPGAGVTENSVDAWIFDARVEGLWDVLVETGQFLLPADNAPQTGDAPGFADWAAGLLRQVDNALGGLGSRAPTTAGVWEQVQGVWLLAGSAGATAAVQQFLNAFTDPPPLAFIYAQHYDPRQQHQLHQFTLENERFSLHVGEGRHYLAPGRVIMIPPHCKIGIGPFGELTSTRSPWSSGHTPNIDELLVIIAAAGLPSPGVLVFSGMGSDGAASLPLLDACGGRIWVQDPADAVCSGMPRAALATGLVHRSGSPLQLARALQQEYPAAI